MAAEISDQKTCAEEDAKAADTSSASLCVCLLEAPANVGRPTLLVDDQ